MNRLIQFALGALLLSLVFLACKEKEENLQSVAIMSVRLHDMPDEYDSVMVNIVGVTVHVDGTGWIDLNTVEGVYDLLQLQNGVDTLIVPSQEIPVGLVSQIRLILGQENELYIAGTAFPLELSSQDETGLKLNVHEEVAANEDVLLTLDFDVSESILLSGNGTYRLKPLISATFQ